VQFEAQRKKPEKKWKLFPKWRAGKWGQSQTGPRGENLKNFS